jgi:hypothetical protein
MSDSGPANKARRNMLAAALAAGVTAPAMARLNPTNSSGTIMAGSLLPQPKQLFQDANWNPLIGGKIYTYAAGTLTPKTTYQDTALTIANTNPTVANARGEVLMYGAGAYRVILKDAAGNTIYDVDNVESSQSIVDSLRQDLDHTNGASMIGSSNGKTVQEQLDFLYYGIVNVCDPKYAGGADPTGAADSTAAWKAAAADLTTGKTFYVPFGNSYKITDTIEFFNKPRCTFQFNGQYIDASGFTQAKNALHFKGISQSRIDDIFLIGNTTFVQAGVSFDADAANISIHCNIGKIYVANCNVGILIGSDLGHQLDDWYVQDLYASDCVRGIVVTGENTLAMAFGRVAAYHNSSIGVHIEQGSGTIQSLQVADAPVNIYFGQTDGKNHKKLNRWDITAGYSEEGQPGEVFIASAACSDTSPFREQIVISGFRCTPFTVTSIQDFVRWRLNGDLIFKNSTFTCGTQLPHFSLDQNHAYRAPRLTVDDCVFDINPPGLPDLALSYSTTTDSQVVDIINTRVNNAASAWNNNGAAGYGTIKRGIDTSKIREFERSLLNVGGLLGGWNLRDIPSSNGRNLVLGGAPLISSATLERRDLWMDDGLLGVLQNATTMKTFTATSAAYTAPAEATFGCFLRATTVGSVEESKTNFGGELGMRIAVYDSGGGAGVCIVGGANAFVPVASPYDAHLVIGRYVSAVSIKVDIVNLRTGLIQTGVTVAGVPANGALTWDTIVRFRSSNTTRGFPFVYSRAISDNETRQLLQAALMLTDAWRLT